MSGIYGVVDPRYTLNARILANQMSTAMSHRERNIAEDYFDDHNNVSNGRLGIGIFNKVPQPVMNATQNRILVMAGEIYNRENLAININDLSDEELILELYERDGEAFVSRLKGVFVIAIFDYEIMKLLIFNDRFGIYPLFYSIRSGKLIFAPEMKGILCDEDFPREIDLTALAQYIRFQHVLGVRTFLEDIQLLPPGSAMAFDLGSGLCTIQSYWSFNDIPFNQNISYDEAVEESARLLDRSVKILSEINFGQESV